MQSVTSDSVTTYAAQLLDATAAAPKDRLEQRLFRFPFVDLRAWFSDASLAELCQCGCVTRVDASAPKVTLEVFAVSGDRAPWPAPAAWRESSFSPTAFDRVITGHRLRGYYYHHHRFWQFYDPASLRGIQLMTAADRIPPWESSGPLRAFLHWAYDGLGMRLAHAATLGLDGRGVLLAGGGGSGKSGTTLAGIARGLQTVGDDYVLLEGGATRSAHAIFSRMKQDVHGLLRVGLDPSRVGTGELNWQGKLEFDPHQVRPGAMTDRMEIVAVLLPKIARQRRTSIVAARAAEAMLALAPSGLFQMPGRAAGGVRFFADFVRQVPAYHLLLSEDPSDIADAIRNFLTNKELARAG